MDPLRSARGGAKVAHDLATEIAEALAASGEYVARIELLPTQELVDFHWAAHQAGRRLGLKVRVEVRMSGIADKHALVRVGPRADDDRD